jgi:hypothetical protein
MEWGILIIVILILSFTTINLLNKNEKLDDYNEELRKTVIDLYDAIDTAYNRMKDIDTLGSFEADDESGYVFKELKTIVDDLKEEFGEYGEEETE